jgi:hypothetical protein
MKRGKRLLCGKCGNSALTILNEVKGYTLYSLGEDGYINGEEYTSDMSATGKVVAQCLCGHSWRVRRVRGVSIFMRPEGE